jgi:uncharacterized membrane protein SpoIIM required for sporulation
MPSPINPSPQRRYFSRSDRFVLTHRDEWVDIARLCRTPLRRWSADEYRRFPGRFLRLCNQLHAAREQRLSSNTIRYLNNLVGRAHRVLYQKSMPKSEGLARYLFYTVPAVLRRRWIFVLVSATVFLGSFFAAMVASMNNPGFAAAIVPEQQLEIFEQMYSGEVFSSRNLAARFSGASYYIQHNTSIAYLSFASGLLAGVGSLYFLLYNGLFLGAVAGYVDNSAGRGNFWMFVTAHGVFELSGLMLAAAAGLFLGWTVLSAGRAGRRANLRESTPEIVGMLVPASAFLLFAALIEGGVSPPARADGAQAGYCRGLCGTDCPLSFCGKPENPRDAGGYPVKPLSPDRITTIYRQLNRRWGLRELPEPPEALPEASAGDTFAWMEGLGPLGIVLAAAIALAVAVLVILTIRRRMAAAQNSVGRFPGPARPGRHRMNLGPARSALESGNLAEAIGLLSAEFLAYLDAGNIVARPAYLTNREIRLALGPRPELRNMFDPISREQERIIYGHRDGDPRRIAELIDRLEAL